MAALGTLVRKIRSKNAGPFWLTIDVFCTDEKNFQHVSSVLRTSTVADLFQQTEDNIRRFDIPQLNVVKISLPRPTIQGAAGDTDMHGASFAALLEELDVGA
jgi:hypothetical protein